jgi:hypothetical protein
MTGSAGPVDIALPLSGSGTPGIECRSGGASNNYQVIFAFPPVPPGPTVSFGTPSVTHPNGTAVIVGTPLPDTTANGTLITFNLTNVSNAQTLTFKLAGVRDGVNQNAYDVLAKMSILVGDANGSGTVNSTDVSFVKAKSGQAITDANIRADVTGDGAINSTDVSIVKSKSGSSLPPAPARLDRQ